LANIINVCLQVSPSLRPGCNKLLSFPATAKRLNDNALKAVLNERNPDLMKTIVVPKNLSILKDTLPVSNYVPLETKIIEKEAFLRTLGGYKTEASSIQSTKDDRQIISQSIDLEVKKRKQERRKPVKHNKS